MVCGPESEMAAQKGVTIELSVRKVDENGTDPQLADSSASTTEEKSVKSVLCALAICLGPLIASATIDYPSPAIPNLNSNPNPFHVTDHQTSWIGSVATLGALVGGLIGGPLMDKIGRKFALMACSCLVSFFWIVIIASPNLTCLLVGRILTGVGTGMYSVICAIYVGEVAPASIRGLLGSCFMLASSSGSVYVYVLGAFLSWRWLAVAISGVNMVFIIALAVIPESPRWLLSMGRKDSAEFALRWLKGDGNVVKQELEKLHEAVRQGNDRASPREFLQPDLLKPLLIALGLMLFHELCGSKVINLYTVQIFQMSKNDLDENVQTIVVGVMAIVGNIVCIVASDYTGRKVLLVASSLLMTLTMSGMGAFFYMLQLDQQYATSSLAWLPMASLMVFNFGYSIAFGPIPFLVMSELFPPRAKGVASGITVAFNWLMAFIMTKFFVNVTNAIYPYGAFWLCSGFCAMSLPFALFCVPETKGKTLEEVQSIFK